MLPCPLHPAPQDGSSGGGAAPMGLKQQHAEVAAWDHLKQQGQGSEDETEALCALAQVGPLRVKREVLARCCEEAGRGLV